MTSAEADAVIANALRRPTRWRRFLRFAVSAQATTLLLVIATCLLIFVTTQARAAALGARQQSIFNRTVVEKQKADASTAAAVQRSAAAAQVHLAASTAKSLLAQVTAENARRDGVASARLDGLEASLLAAISELETTVKRYGQSSATRASACPMSCIP